ncbi:MULTISPECIES: glycoside hydrolase family 108 protein [unclassified Pseudovibrio]|uniref:glycoside hydrolase family 108 protein n=1 Tax=unclassified Pseudovibrio TaxID=2627060 RepID=UPI0007AE7D21|nr:MULTISPECIES: glycoside hydrolase family 108 protein [unclassified Pseudovibrio]KZL02889.1 putative Peptidoglycan domain protein [Pseudovibrio sp. W74]KZL07592.1 putative Peptidoglycan domain protein [Pseudovibrio sp. Ad14]
MQDTFQLIVSDLLESEGGFAHRSRKADPGGPTNFGITQRTLSAWRGQSVSVQEVRSLERAEAVDIFRAQYWDAVKGDKMPSGLDYALFDFAVNSGPARAVKTLQSILGVAVDGLAGVETLGALKTHNLGDLVSKLSAERLRFMKRLKNWPYNKNGWTRRVRDVQQRSLELIKSPASAVQTLRVRDSVVPDGAAKARGEETSAMSTWWTPEGVSKAGVLISGMSGMLAGSGPLQWAFVFALVVAAGIGGYLMLQKERMA